MELACPRTVLFYVNQGTICIIFRINQKENQQDMDQIWKKPQNGLTSL